MKKPTSIVVLSHIIDKEEKKRHYDKEWHKLNREKDLECRRQCRKREAKDRKWAEKEVKERPKYTMYNHSTLVQVSAMRFDSVLGKILTRKRKYYRIGV